MKTKFLEIYHIRNICFKLARELLPFDEPLPPFDSRFQSKLEFILEIPKQGMLNGYMYKDFTEKASVLFYSMVKEHPFLNGNKRIAVVSRTAAAGRNTKD